MRTSRVTLIAAALASCLARPAAAAVANLPERSVTEPLSDTREQVRPDPATLPVPRGFSRQQIVLGDHVFHGEVAGGRCSTCHGADAKGTAVGNDLTTGMYIWGDGTVAGVKGTLMHNMAIAPGMDGELTPDDVDAVAAYVWALGRAR